MCDHERAKASQQQTRQGFDTVSGGAAERFPGFADVYAAEARAAEQAKAMGAFTPYKPTSIAEWLSMQIVATRRNMMALEDLQRHLPAAYLERPLSDLFPNGVPKT